MATQISFKKINLDFVAKNYPLLFNSINKIEGLSDKQKELVAGLSVEVMIKCDGTSAIFEDEFELDEYTEDTF